MSSARSQRGYLAGGTTGMRHDREPPPRGAPRLAAHGVRTAAVGRTEPVVRPAQRVHPGPLSRAEGDTHDETIRAASRARNGWWNRLLTSYRRSRQQAGRRRRPESRVDGHQWSRAPVRTNTATRVGTAARLCDECAGSGCDGARTCTFCAGHGVVTDQLLPPHRRSVVTPPGARQAGRSRTSLCASWVPVAVRACSCVLWRWRWELTLLATAAVRLVHAVPLDVLLPIVGRASVAPVRRVTCATPPPERPVLVRGDPAPAAGSACASRTSARGAAGCRRSCGRRPAATASSSCWPARGRGRRPDRRRAQRAGGRLSGPSTSRFARTIGTRTWSSSTSCGTAREGSSRDESARVGNHAGPQSLAAPRRRTAEEHALGRVRAWGTASRRTPRCAPATAYRARRCSTR